MPRIHPSAIVDPGAELGAEVEVGAFSIVEKDVVIGDHTRIGSHVLIRSHTAIGAHNRIFQFCSIGEEPQHQDYAGEPTRLQIGERNTIREYCTLNRGTATLNRGAASGLGVTRLGDDNFIMAYAHIAHDCTLGDHVIFANGASLAGHVEVGDHAILGGFSLVHQYCNVGAHCITGIGAVCLQDVPPYIIAAGNSASPFGINVKGLRRRDYGEDTIGLLKRAYRLLYRSNLDLQTAIGEIQRLNRDSPEVSVFCDFLRRAKCGRGIIR